MQFDKQQKNVQFFNMKKPELVLMSLLDSMYKYEFVWFYIDFN